MKKALIFLLCCIGWLLLPAQALAQTFTKADTAVAVVYYTIQAGDYPTALNLIREGKKLHPERYADFLSMEVNCYLATSRASFALQLLDEALFLYKDSTLLLPTLYYNKGWAYSEIANKAGTEFDTYYALAIENFNKVIALDPSFDAAYLGIANYYLAHGNGTLDAANELPLDLTQAYHDMKAVAIEEYKKAIPYLEKAYELKPEVYKKTLNDVYRRTEQLDKVKQ